MKSSGSGARVSRIFVLLSAALAAFVLVTAASASAGTLDQQQTSFNTNVGLVTTQSGAETFTDGISGVLDRADLNLMKVGTPPSTVTVEIRTTYAGIPTATALATGTIATSAIGASGAFVPVVFATPALVTAGTQYALVAYSGGSVGNAVGWSVQDSGSYAGGEAFISNDPIPPGANWGLVSTRDFAFKTYVGPAPPSSTGRRAAALKRCKKRAQKNNWSKDRLKKCKKKARLLPV
jgi:hypothetical protein